MNKPVRMLVKLVPAFVVAAAAVFLYRNFTTNQTIETLLRENTALKDAISNLTQEEKIGYAKVLSQTLRDGKLYTSLLFVETAPGDPAEQIFRQEYEIEGDIVHFDTMVVKFSSDLVADGKERAMYMWRRVYGESTAPQDGHLIHQPGKPSPRYVSLTERLDLKEKQLFWDEIWSLSDNPEKLERLGITAVFGNVVYKKLRPGVVYIFKANSTGSIHPETIPLL